MFRGVGQPPTRCSKIYHIILRLRLRLRTDFTGPIFFTASLGHHRAPPLIKNVVIIHGLLLQKDRTGVPISERE